MKTGKIINKDMPLQMQTRKNLKSPSLIPLLTRLPFALVETRVSLRALGNHHVLPYENRKDIHLSPTESLVGL